MEAPPPKTSVEESSMIPEAQANWVDLLTFGWLTPLLSLGYARPLEAPDLYKLQDHRGAAFIGDKITESFERRRVAAEEYNARLLSGQVKPGLKAVWWTLRGNRVAKEKQWREKDGQRKPSLVYAMNDSVKWWFWSGGILKVIGDTASVTSPLVVKVCLSRSSVEVRLFTFAVGNHKVQHPVLLLSSVGRLRFYPTHREGHRILLPTFGVASYQLPLYSPVFLPRCIHRSFAARRPNQRHLFPVPSFVFPGPL